MRALGSTHLRTVAQGSGMSVAIQQADGDYVAVVVSGANRDIDEAQIAASGEAIRGSGVLVLQNEVPEPANAAAARGARAAGVTVLLNAAPARPLGGLAGLVDVLVVNTVEAEMLGAGPVSDLASAAAPPATCWPWRRPRSSRPAPSGSRPSPVPRPGQRPGTRSSAPTRTGPVTCSWGRSRLVSRAVPRITEALRYANAAAALHVGTPEAERTATGPADVWRLLSGTTAG